MNSDDSLGDLTDISSIGSGAVVFVIGFVFQTVAGFLLNLLLTRGLGAAMYGTYSYARTLLAIAKVFAEVGASESILRFLPEYEGASSKQNNILGLALLTTIVGSLLVVVSIHYFAPEINKFTLDNEQFAATLRLFIFSLPFMALLVVVANIFRGVEKPVYQISLQKIFYPIIRLVAVGVALFLGYSLFGVVAAFVIASALGLLLGGYLLLTRTDFRPSLPVDRGDAYEYYDYSIPLMFTAAGSLLYSRVDVLMVGYFFTDVEVGVYSIAILIATFLGLPLSALNQIFPPVASRLHNNGSRGELNTIFATTTRWAFTFSLLFALVATIYRTEILRIFGERFVLETTVLFLFIVAQAIRNAVGPSGYMLMMTGHQYLVMINRWALGLLNVVLNYVLILEVGFIGAALGSAGALAAVNLLRVVEIYYLEGYFPYTRQYLKPVVAGIVAGPAMLVLTTVLDGLVLLFVGGFVGTTAFFAVLYLLGLEERDRELLRRGITSLR
jgi:O-antigen/teichoic acid export membrane protein